jgi:hypothetical protein
MTMRSNYLWLPFFALVVSCVGTDVGNPPDDDRRVTGMLEFAAYQPSTDDDSATASESGRASALVVEGGTDLESVWLSVDEIVVTPANDCRPSAERAIQGPWVVDLLEGRVYPEPPVLTRSPDEFCALRLELAPMKFGPDEAPVGLEGKSFQIVGTTPAGNSLTITSGSRRRLKYDGDEFVVGGDDTDEEHFIAAFEPDAWLEDLDVDNQGQSPIGLDDNRSPASIATFWSTFGKNSRIVRDGDRDGAIDGTEYADPVGLPRN